MQILVNISEKEYESIKKHNPIPTVADGVNAYNAVLNGTPLPKGHGRILDEKDILDTENNDGGWYDLVDMPEYIAGVKAIIEAERSFI